MSATIYRFTRNTGPKDGCLLKPLRWVESTVTHFWALGFGFGVCGLGTAAMFFRGHTQEPDVNMRFGNAHHSEGVGSPEMRAGLWDVASTSSGFWEFCWIPGLGTPDYGVLCSYALLGPYCWPPVLLRSHSLEWILARIQKLRGQEFRAVDLWPRLLLSVWAFQVGVEVSVFEVGPVFVECSGLQARHPVGDGSALEFMLTRPAQNEGCGPLLDLKGTPNDYRRETLCFMTKAIISR